MAFALLEGFQLQPSASVIALNPVFPFASGGPSTIDVNLLTVNQACGLISIRVQAINPFIYNLVALESSPLTDLYLRITVDGATSQLIQFLQIPAASGAPSTPVPFANDLLTFATFQYGWGNVAGDFVVEGLGLSCRESLTVDFYGYVPTTNSIAATRTLVGEMIFSIGYALQVN